MGLFPYGGQKSINKLQLPCFLLWSIQVQIQMYLCGAMGETFRTCDVFPALQTHVRAMSPALLPTYFLNWCWQHSSLSKAPQIQLSSVMCVAEGRVGLTVGAGKEVADPWGAAQADVLKSKGTRSCVPGTNSTPGTCWKVFVGHQWSPHWALGQGIWEGPALLFTWWSTTSWIQSRASEDAELEAGGQAQCDACCA